MTAKRTSITIKERLWRDAQRRMADLYCDNFSEYVEALVREDILAHGGTLAPRTSETGSDYLSPAVVEVDTGAPGEPRKIIHAGKIVEIPEPPLAPRRKKVHRPKPQTA